VAVLLKHYAQAVPDQQRGALKGVSVQGLI
jgi:hypothetical protein